MCPGRTFTKQEVLGSVAVLLLGLDVDFVGFVKKAGGRFEDGAGLSSIKKGFAGNQVEGIGDVKWVKIKRKA